MISLPFGVQLLQHISQVLIIGNGYSLGYGKMLPMAFTCDSAYEQRYYYCLLDIAQNKNYHFRKPGKKLKPNNSSTVTESRTSQDSLPLYKQTLTALFLLLLHISISCTFTNHNNGEPLVRFLFQSHLSRSSHHSLSSSSFHRRSFGRVRKSHRRPPHQRPCSLRQRDHHL